VSPKSTATLHTRHSKKKLPQLNEVDDGRFFFTLHGTSATIPLTRQPVRDLGVWIDSDPYTFKEHTERVTDKALKHLGFLRSVGSAMSPKTAYSLYLGVMTKRRPTTNRNSCGVEVCCNDASEFCEIRKKERKRGEGKAIRFHACNGWTCRLKTLCLSTSNTHTYMHNSTHRKCSTLQRTTSS